MIFKVGVKEWRGAALGKVIRGGARVNEVKSM